MERILVSLGLWSELSWFKQVIDAYPMYIIVNSSGTIHHYAKSLTSTRLTMIDCENLKKGVGRCLIGSLPQDF